MTVIMVTTRTFLLTGLILLSCWFAGVQCDCPDSWIPFQGSCYLFGTELEEYVVAEQFCTQHGAHLVHVNSAIENTFIKSWLSRFKPGSWWMGLTDRLIERIWMWEDTNTAATFTNWHPGQPDNSENHENCAHFPSLFVYEWNDCLCTNKYYPLCEKSRSDENVVVG